MIAFCLIVFIYLFVFFFQVIETKRGWYYTLCVIFQSVARRLGLRSDILEAEFDSTLLPNDFEDELSILGWREK